MGFLSSTLYLLVWCSKGVTEWTFLCLWVYSWGLTATTGGSDHSQKQKHPEDCWRSTRTFIYPMHSAKTKPRSMNKNCGLQGETAPFSYPEASARVQTPRLCPYVEQHRSWTGLRLEVPSSLTEVACSFAVVLVHPRSTSALVPLGVRPIVADQQWLTERDAHKRTELYVSLGPFCCFIFALFGCFLFYCFSFSAILNTLPNSYALCAQLWFVHDL